MRLYLEFKNFWSIKHILFTVHDGELYLHAEMLNLEVHCSSYVTNQIQF